MRKTLSILFYKMEMWCDIVADDRLIWKKQKSVNLYK